MTAMASAFTLIAALVFLSMLAAVAGASTSTFTAGAFVNVSGMNISGVLANTHASDTLYLDFNETIAISGSRYLENSTFASGSENWSKATSELDDSYLNEEVNNAGTWSSVTQYYAADTVELQGASSGSFRVQAGLSGTQEPSNTSAFSNYTGYGLGGMYWDETNFTHFTVSIKRFNNSSAGTDDPDASTACLEFRGTFAGTDGRRIYVCGRNSGTDAQLAAWNTSDFKYFFPSQLDLWYNGSSTSGWRNLSATSMLDMCNSAFPGCTSYAIKNMSLIVKLSDASTNAFAGLGLNVSFDNVTFFDSSAKYSSQVIFNSTPTSQVSSIYSIDSVNVSVHINSTVSANYQVKIYNWTDAAWDLCETGTIPAAANETASFSCNKTGVLDKYRAPASIDVNRPVQLLINKTDHNTSSQLSNASLRVNWVKYYIDSRPGCGSALDGNYYNLTSSISSDSSCFPLNSHVDLECWTGNGQVWINQSSSTTNIWAAYNTSNSHTLPSSNLTVRNCGFGNWTGGPLNLSNGTFGATFSNNTVLGAGGIYGVFIINGSNTLVENSTFRYYNNSIFIIDQYAIEVRNNQFLTNGTIVTIIRNNNASNSSGNNYSIHHNNFTGSSLQVAVNLTGGVLNGPFSAGTVDVYSNNFTNSTTAGIAFLATGYLSLPLSPMLFIARDNTFSRQASTRMLYGIEVKTNNTRIYNNNFTGYDYGITCDIGFALTAKTSASHFFNNSFYNTSLGAAIYATLCHNLTSWGNTVHNFSTYAFQLHGSSNGKYYNETVSNGTVNSVNGYAFYLDAGGGLTCDPICYSAIDSLNNTVINSSMNKSTIFIKGIPGTELGGQLLLQEWVRANVTNANAVPVLGAGVNVTNRSAQHQSWVNLSTDASGLTAWSLVNESFWNGTAVYNETHPCADQANLTCYAPYNISAIAGTVSNSTNSSLNHSRTIWIILAIAGDASTFTDKGDYGNCGVVYYKLVPYWANKTVYTPQVSAQVNISDATATLYAANVTVSGGSYTGAVQLPDSANYGLWHLKAWSESTSSRDFYVSSSNHTMANNTWKINIDTNNTKGHYSSSFSEVVNVSIFVLSQKGEGITGLSSPSATRNLTLQVNGTYLTSGLVEQGFGHYYYVFNTTSLPAGWGLGHSVLRASAINGTIWATNSTGVYITS